MGSFVCRVEISKEKGIIVTAENPGDNITQEIRLDGTTITTTVKGAGGESTIAQDAESVKIQCKKFSLEAETISCKARKGLSLESGNSVEIKGAKVAVNADGNVAVSGAGARVEGKSSTEIKGAALKLEGSATAEMKAASIKLDAQGMLNLMTNGIATLKGSMSNIKGIVKLGG